MRDVFQQELHEVQQRLVEIAELVAEDTVESAGREENIQELIGVASEFMQVDEFLEQVALVLGEKRVVDLDPGAEPELGRDGGSRCG